MPPGTPVILAAGLSPAWQQIVLLDRLETGEVNRAREVHWCASGKVLNVALALHALSTSPPLTKGGPGGVAPKQTELTQTPTRPSEQETSNGERRTSNAEWCSVELQRSSMQSRALALIGGHTGAAIRAEFDAAGIAARWIESATPTRVCTTILEQSSGATTELVENAGGIIAAELAAFRQAFVEESRHAAVIVLTGSLPAGAPPTLYGELMAHSPGRVILDCQGPLLLAALERGPFVVKPNREELGRTLGRSVATDVELHAAMRELNSLGARWVVVSQGKRPVWISSADQVLSLEPPVMTAVNPIGSGDCLAAGIAIGLAAGYDLPAAAAFGIAAAAENVQHLLPARLDVPMVNQIWEKLRSSSES